MGKSTVAFPRRKELAIFTDEVLRCQKRWGITDWDIVTGQEDMPGCYAKVFYTLDSSKATILLCSEWEDAELYPMTEKNVRRTARHEVIHLLLGRVMGLARWRHTAEDQLVEAEHALIVKLQALLP